MLLLYGHVRGCSHGHGQLVMVSWSQPLPKCSSISLLISKVATVPDGYPDIHWFLTVILTREQPGQLNTSLETSVFTEFS